MKDGFNLQAEGLAEFVGNDSYDEQCQLKEIYDDLDREEMEKEIEFEHLQNENKLINKLLDTYGVPRVDNKIKLSLIERVELLAKRRMFA